MSGDNLTKKELLEEINRLRDQLKRQKQPPSQNKTSDTSINFELSSDSSDLAIMVVQEEKIVFVNRTVLKFLNCRRSDIVGQPVSRLLQPEEKDLVLDRHRRRTQGQEPLPSYSLRYLDREGRIALVELRAIRITFEGKPAVLCIFLDMAKTGLSREVVEAQRNLGLASTPKGPQADPLAASLKMAVRISNSFGGAVLLRNRLGKLEPVVSEALESKTTENLAEALNRPGPMKILKTGRPHYPGTPGKTPIGRAWAALDNQTHLSAALPLLHQGEPIAWLVLVSPSPQKIDETIREALEAIAPLAESIISRIIFEQASQENKKRFQSLVETMPQGLGIYDPEGRFTYANKALCQMLGYPPEDLLGRRAVDFIAPENEEFFQKHVSEGLRTAPEPYEVEWLRKNGESVHALNYGQPTFSQDGSFSGTFVITADVTAMKRARKALAESEAKFRGAFDNAAVGMALVDPQGVYLEVNEAFCRMLGYPADELLGSNQNEFVYREDPSSPISTQSWFSDSKEEPKAVPDTRFLRQDGKVAWAIQASSQVRDSQGKPLYHIRQYIDVSEQHLVAQALSATHEEYHRIYQSLPLPCITWTKEEEGFRILNFNLAMSELLGATGPITGKGGIETFFKNRTDIVNDLEFCVSNRSYLQRETVLNPDASQNVRYIHLTYTFIPPHKVLMICKDDTGRHNTLTALKESEEHLRSLMESSREFCIFRLKVDPEPPYKRSVVFASPSIRDIVGTSDPMNIESWYSNILPDDEEKWHRAREKGQFIHGFNEIIRIDHPRKGVRWLRVISKIVPGGAGRFTYSNGMMSDITDLKQAELALKEKEEELQTRTTSLTESNIALRVLLRNLQQDKETFQENIIANIKKQILSGLDWLVKSGITLPQEAKIESIFESIDEVTSPFVKRLSAEYLGLTKRELEVSKQVRAGLSTSRIAESLGISANAVAVHRKNIRAKLGIKSRKVNLSVYLQKLSD